MPGWAPPQSGSCRDGDQANGLDEGTPESPTRCTPIMGRTPLGSGRLCCGSPGVGAASQARPRGSRPGWLFGRVDTSGGWDPVPPASPPRRLRLFELQVSVEQGSAENGERFLRVRQLPHDQVDADRVPDLQRQDEAEHA